MTDNATESVGRREWEHRRLQSGAVSSSTAYTDAVITAHVGAADPHSGYQLESTLTETVQDIVGAFITAGTGVTTTYDDASNTLTVRLKSDYTPMFSCGLVSGGQPSINADPTKFDIASGVAMFVDYTNPDEPVPTRVAFSAQTGITATFLATHPITYVGVNSAGTVVQSSSSFTESQRRSIALVAIIGHTNLTTITSVAPQATPIRNVANQVHDVMDAIGTLVKDGIVYSANGANLNLNRSVGNLFKMGSNFATDPTQPHTIAIAAATALTFRYRTQTGDSGGDVTAIDPNFYDVAGVKTAMPPNKFSVQRIYVFQNGLTRVQYGQATYNTLSAAIENYRAEVFVEESSNQINGTLRCYLIVKEGTTTLNSATSAVFNTVTKFGTPVGDRTAALDNTLIVLGATDWALDSMAIGTGADTVAQVAFAANTFPAKASTGNLVAKPITDFGLSLVDDSNAAAGRTTLGLGTIATQNANAVAITGGSIEGTPIGSVTPSTSVFEPFMSIQNTAGAVAIIALGSTGAGNRWFLQKGQTAESGSNAGSELQIVARTDAGAFLDIPVTITRAAGGPVTIARPVAFGANAVTGSNVTITGGAINNTPIGATAQNTARFTTLGVNGAVSAGNELHVTGQAQFDSGHISLGGTGAAHTSNPSLYRSGIDHLSIATGGSEWVRLLASGELIHGHTASITIGQALGVQQHSVGASAGYGASRWSADTTAPRIALGKSRGASIGTFTAVASGDNLGTFDFNGADGTSFVRGALIAAAASGTVGTNIVPSDIYFSTMNTSGTLAERFRVDFGGNHFATQAAPAAVNTTATLTVANLRTRIITSTTAAAVTGTLPTGTSMDTLYSSAVDIGYDWSVINTGATNTFTVAANTAHTVVGNMVVAVSSSGHFRSRRTAANTWVTYRIG